MSFSEDAPSSIKGQAQKASVGPGDLVHWQSKTGEVDTNVIGLILSAEIASSGRCIVTVLWQTEAGVQAMYDNWVYKIQGLTGD